MNPPWVTKAIADSYELMEKQAPAEWLPKLEGIDSNQNQIYGALVEYGCGAYGCVYPTLDQNVVLKVTTDDTEAEFATTISNDLVAPVCVEYFMAMKLSGRYKGRPIFLLWREGAREVGKIDKILGRGAEELIAAQHEAAQHAFAAVRELREAERYHPPEIVGMNRKYMNRMIEAWLGSLETMQYQQEYPQLRELATGMLKIWEAQHVLFGDIHGGNLGMVTRDDGGHWVITDPGHIAVVT